VRGIEGGGRCRGNCRTKPSAAVFSAVQPAGVVHLRTALCGLGTWKSPTWQRLGLRWLPRRTGLPPGDAAAPEGNYAVRKASNRVSPAGRVVSVQKPSVEQNVPGEPARVQQLLPGGST